MREKTVNIGRPLPLVGVLCEPDSPDAQKPVVLLLNSGVMHHIGSCRVSVKLARALANNAGLVSVRFDFSGIGDSEPRRGAPSFDLAAVEEVREVMDYLQKTRGVERFILYGLCSGAVIGMNTAVLDSRVIGVAQIDGLSYLTPKWYVQHYLPRIFSYSRWSGVLAKILGRKMPSSKMNGAEVAGIEEEYFEVPGFESTPPKSETQQKYRQLVGQKVKLFCAFTDSEGYNYQSQFRDCMSGVSFRDLLTLEHWQDTSHIMSEPSSQVLAVERICTWMDALGRECLGQGGTKS